MERKTWSCTQCGFEHPLSHAPWHACWGCGYTNTHAAPPRHPYAKREPFYQPDKVVKPPGGGQS